MDQGNISLFKKKYKKEVFKKFIGSIDDTSGFSNNSSTSKIMGSISILTAVHMMNKSWNNISSEAIKKCITKCNFSTDITNMKWMMN